MSMEGDVVFSKRPAAVVDAGPQEIRQYIVGIRGAYKLTHRQAQKLGQIAGQNVTEVSGRNREIHPVTNGDLPRDPGSHDMP